MPELTRITRDPAVMGGKPCSRGMRVTVGTVVGLVAAGRTRDEILRQCPYLEPEDIAEALSYAAWRAEEVEVRCVSRELLVDMNLSPSWVERLARHGSRLSTGPPSARRPRRTSRS
jgi:uncharacterized protein (DUF433 family)